MKRTRVKICGITRLEDALVAIDSGADALGFVFYKPSPRYIDPEEAAAIIRQLPAFVTTTALFVNENSAEIDRILQLTRIDLIQFHGDECPELCASFARPYIKAIRMKEGILLEQKCKDYSTAQAILLDAYRAGVPGGTGDVFDWQRIIQPYPARIILAGGLSSDNVAEAIKIVAPYAVDVSGGVEASKGIKDANKIEMFINEVTRAN